MAPAHQSWIRENLALVLFAVVVIAGFIVVGVDVANHKHAPATGLRAGAGGGVRAGAGSGSMALTAVGMTVEQRAFGHIMGWGPWGAGYYTSIGNHYCADYYKYNRHETTDYGACQSFCDEDEECNAIGLGSVDKCITYRGCIPSMQGANGRPITQSWGDTFFVNERKIPSSKTPCLCAGVGVMCWGCECGSAMSNQCLAKQFAEKMKKLGNSVRHTPGR